MKGLPFSLLNTPKTLKSSFLGALCVQGAVGCPWLPPAPVGWSWGSGVDKAPLADRLDTQLPREVSPAPVGNAHRHRVRPWVQEMLWLSIHLPTPAPYELTFATCCSSSPGANSSRVTAYPRNHKSSFLGKAISISTISCCSAPTPEPEGESLC